MATYFRFGILPYSTSESPSEKRLRGVRSFFDLCEQGISLATLILKKLRHHILKSAPFFFIKLKQYLSYLDLLGELVALKLAKSINIIRGIDFIAKVGGFVVSTLPHFIASFPTTVGTIYGVALNSLRAFPFYIAMLMTNDPNRRERLFFHGMKSTLTTVSLGVVSLIIAVGLVFAPLVTIIVTSLVMGPLILLAAVKLVQEYVWPAVKTVAQEAIVPLIKKVIGEKTYANMTASLSAAKEKATSFFANIAARFKQVLNIKQTEEQKNPEKVVKIVKPSEPIFPNVLDIFAKGKTTNQKRTFIMVDYHHLLSKKNNIEQLVAVPDKKENDSFDYFKYVVKEKRPFSVLMRDIVQHRKEIEEEMKKTTFLDRMQYSKRADKVRALHIIENFIIQWKQFAEAPQKSQNKAFIIEEKNGKLISIPFKDLINDRDKIVKQYNDYIREKCSNAMQSSLFRGKVELLIRESYAWIKRPSVDKIQNRIDDYHQKQPDDKSGLLEFLSMLLRETHSMLENVLHTDCNVYGLSLSRKELIDRSNHQALYNKIMKHVLTSYPDFESSLIARGERSKMLLDIMRNIYRYDADSSFLYPMPIGLKPSFSIDAPSVS